jgi:hypothetical protein
MYLYWHSCVPQLARMCASTGAHVCLNWHACVPQLARMCTLTGTKLGTSFGTTLYLLRMSDVGHADETDERIRPIRVVTPLLMNGLMEHVAQRRSSVREAALVKPNRW